MELTSTDHEKYGSNDDFLAWHFVRPYCTLVLKKQLTSGASSDITASAIRFQYLFVDVNDLSWTLPPVFLWTNIESDVGIICACLPAMMPLVRLIRDKCGSKKSLSPVVPKAFSLSKMAWPCGRISEQVLPTERDSLTLVGDQIDSLSSTSRASTNTVPDNEPARLLRRLEEDWPLRRVHLRPDENVVHGRV